MIEQSWNGVTIKKGHKDGRVREKISLSLKEKTRQQNQSKPSHRISIAISAISAICSYSALDLVHLWGDVPLRITASKRWSRLMQRLALAGVSSCGLFWLSAFYGSFKKTHNNQPWPYNVSYLHWSISILYTRKCISLLWSAVSN